MAAERHQPTPDVVEARIGTWDTIAGDNPSAEALIERAETLIEQPRQADEEVAKRSLQFIWRRQGMVHGGEWKTAEQRVLGLLSAIRQERWSA